MAKKFKWSEAEIETLCKDCCHQIKEQGHGVLSNSLRSDKITYCPYFTLSTDADFRFLVELCKYTGGTIYKITPTKHELRSLCGGGRCGCSSVSPAQKLSQLVRAQLARAIHVDCSVGLSIISNYTSLSYHSHCLAALENLLRHVLKSEMSETKRYFLNRLWICPGLKEFEIELVTDFVCIESKYIELDLLSLFEKNTGESVECELKHQIWDDSKFERIVYWSSKSAKVFCTVSSILNTLLHQTLSSRDQFEASGDIVSSFIHCVKNSCSKNKTDFVFLYPSDYHSLVSLMEVNPSLYLQNSPVIVLKVVELFKNSLVRNQAQTLCLLTHFPEWIPYIDR